MQYQYIITPSPNYYYYDSPRKNPYSYNMFTPYTTFITTTTKCSKIQGFFITFFFEKIDFFGAYKTPDKFPQFTYINMMKITG